MNRAKIMTWAGAIGVTLGVICCVTPILPIALEAVGASGLLHYIYSDVILLSFAALSFAVMVAGLRLRRAAA